MINIAHKEDCCGCGACISACPRKCIVFTSDEEGFLYPYINAKDCIDCHLCERICPIINNNVESKIPTAYGCLGNDTIRMKSSSGGVFTLLSEYVIQRGGIVFGAKFDNSWHLIHDNVDSLDDLDSLRRSKYVQSNIHGCFQHVKYYLEKNKIVLFSGTPCQISGLQCYLGKEYESLFLVDVICHGVPSPYVWEKYLRESIDRVCNIANAPKKSVKVTDVNFREKTNGWRKYNISIKFDIGNEEYVERENIYKNMYMKFFLDNITLRPSCYNCKFRNQKSGSDITLGDFWGCENFFQDDDKGISLVLLNTDKGKSLFSNIRKVSIIPVDFNEVVPYNKSLQFSYKRPLFRNRFFLLSRFFSLNRIYNYYIGKSNIIEKLAFHTLFLLFRK